jgi:hypothetical protein
VLTLGLLSLWIDAIGGQGPMTRPEDIKATFLYNFAKFVEWPDSSFDETVTSFRIEIVGRDPFDGRFDQLMIGKTMLDLPIEVIHSLRQASSRPVHIAFVSASEAKRLDSLLDGYRLNQVLTVSDMPNFTERGGMIGFVVQPGAVRFRIDQETVERAQLHMSSRLLALGMPPTLPN